MPTLPHVGHGILNDIAICIVAAWLFSVLAQILKQPLILAYLAAGFIIGPEGVRLIESKESIETISEVGLILLLFMIGLEIDLKKILGAGKLILLTGAAQIFGGVLVGMLAFPFLKIDAEIGQLNVLYLAVAAALSSTVIIVKLLYDKKELDTLPGRITLGVLILQDLFAILFLALQPNLKNPQALPLLLSLVKAVVLVVIAFTASRYALPHVFRRVARHPELVLVGSLAWCFLMAGLGDVLGLSREMGALIAGVAISTFPYTLDVSAKVTSLRDFFVTLFFVSLGMSIPEPSIALLTMAL
ncbi:MAG TPA: cation:proton antiporter, partial [Roseimicrobium sp.]|nr:cation:proton antiporter [Roseimicrobium sp.]